MSELLLLVGLVVGPLRLARIRRFAPAPGGIVVSPTAPKLDLRVEFDADDPRTKPLVATLTGQRPQPSNAPDATAVIRIEPQVQLASPEALDRIAYALDAHPHIAVYPWQKINRRSDTLSMFAALFEAFTRSSEAPPHALVARRTDSGDERPVVYLGGHIVAEVRPRRRIGRVDPLGVVVALAFFGSCVGAALNLVADFGLASFAVYATAVFALSLCLRQVGKYTRLATLVYPLTLVAGVVRGALPAAAPPAPSSRSVS